MHFLLDIQRLFVCFLFFAFVVYTNRVETPVVVFGHLKKSESTATRFFLKSRFKQKTIQTRAQQKAYR